MNALNTAVTALGQSRPGTQVVNANDPINLGTHWCHDCKERVMIAEFKCPNCGGFFVEEYAQQSPAFVVPQIADGSDDRRGEVLNENGQPIGVQQEQD